MASDLSNIFGFKTVGTYNNASLKFSAPVKKNKI